MKAIRVDNATHAQFKAACALRGLSMSVAAGAALKMLMKSWQAENAKREAWEQGGREHKQNGSGD